MSNAKLYQILSQGFSTIDADTVTGEKKDTKVVDRTSYLAEFEIDKIIKLIREYETK